MVHFYLNFSPCRGTPPILRRGGSLYNIHRIFPIHTEGIQNACFGLLLTEGGGVEEIQTEETHPVLLLLIPVAGGGCARRISFVCALCVKPSPEWAWFVRSGVLNGYCVRSCTYI